VKNEVSAVVVGLVEGVVDVDIRREGGLIVAGMSDMAVSAEVGESWLLLLAMTLSATLSTCSS